MQSMTCVRDKSRGIRIRSRPPEIRRGWTPRWRGRRPTWPTRSSPCRTCWSYSTWPTGSRRGGRRTASAHLGSWSIKSIFQYISDTATLIGSGYSVTKNQSSQLTNILEWFWIDIHYGASVLIFCTFMVCFTSQLLSWHFQSCAAQLVVDLPKQNIRTKWMSHTVV